MSLKVSSKRISSWLASYSRRSFIARDRLYFADGSLQYSCYHRTSTIGDSLISKIEKCVIDTNHLFREKKEQEFNNNLIELKKYCSQLSEEGEKKLNDRTWNFLIQQFSNNESFHQDAIFWFKRMTKLVNPNHFTLNSILRTLSHVGDIESCEEILQELECQGRCNVFAYIHYMKACLKNGNSEKAFSVIERMERNNVEPNFGIYIPLFKEATNSSNRVIGLKLYDSVNKANLESPQLSSTISAFAMKMKMPEIAIKEYEKMRKTTHMTVTSWTCLIQAYIQNNEIEKGFEIFNEMKSTANSTTYTILLTACANTKKYDEGLLIIQTAKKNLKEFTIELTTSIVNFYTKCGRSEMAIKECYNLKQRGLMNVVSWNCLIQAFIQSNEMEKALQTFYEIENVANPTTYIILLTALANCNKFEEGEHIYEVAKRRLVEFPIELSNTVINFYTKCGKPQFAIKDCYNLIDKGMADSVTWNCLIQAFIQNNDIEKTFEIFKEMKSTANSTTFSILLTACANYGHYEFGIRIHEEAKRKFTEFPIELSNSIINFYIKCRKPENAIKECKSLKEKGVLNLITYTCLIQAYIQLIDLNKVFTTYQQMKSYIEPDIFTFNILLSACGEYVALNIGNQIIQDIKIKGIDNNEEIASTMLYFYYRTGQYETAQPVLKKLLGKHREGNALSIISYGNVLSCFVNEGKVQQAKLLFNEMVEHDIELNEIIFIILLNAFSHCGMVDDALRLYHEMQSKYKINPTSASVCAMVDVYSRAGKLKKAENLIGERRNVEMWTALMGGCRKFNDIEMGEKVFDIITNIDQQNTSSYILLSNIYSHHGLIEKLDKLRKLIEERGIKKIPAIVSYEENGNVFKFLSGAEEYDRKEQVERMRNEVYQKIINVGFKDDTRWVTNTKLTSEEEKVKSLRQHAEKSAIAHALVMNPNRKQVILRSNLRMCNDCHNMLTYISQVMKIEIILRDANRYHHFKNGKCSCANYW